MRRRKVFTTLHKRQRQRTALWIQRCAAASIVLAATGAGAHKAQAVVGYVITNIGSFAGGDSSYATGINNNGQVVGFSQNYSSTTKSYYDQAFLYSNGTMTNLTPTSGEFSGESSYATGINNSGEVVGYSNTSGGYTHAFSYSSGTMTDLGTFSGNNGNFNASAFGINSTGQVVGYSSISGNVDEYNAFEYSSGSMTNLGTLSSYPNGSFAYGINSSGQIVGYSSNTTNNTNHAFVYSSGTMTDLGTLGGSNSYARGINASGEIVGSADTSSGSYNAFLYSSGKMTNLGTLSGYTNSSVALGINSSGQVVGASGNSNLGSEGFASFHAFYYNGTSMVDLNSIISPNSGWDLFKATGINDSGQIIGFGSYTYPSGQSFGYQAFLLTPISAEVYWNNNSGNGLWDINTSANWNNVAGGVNPTTYSNTDAVYFDDVHNNGNYNVTLNTTVDPVSVTVNNSAGNYVISGTGFIAGSTALVKEGSDNLTLSTADSYIGGTQIGEGKLIVGNSSAIPTDSYVTFGDGTSDSGTLDLNGIGATVGGLAVYAGSSGTQTITNNGTQTATLTFAGGTSAVGTFSGVLAGTNAASTFSGVIQNGSNTTALTVTSGTLTLSGTNTYTGVTNINGGTVYAGNFNALGSTTGGAVNIAAGATLDIGGIADQASGGFGAKTFNIAGAGAAGSLGVIQDNGGASGGYGTAEQTSAFENITLTANATIGGTNEAWSTTPYSNDGRFDIGRDGGTLNLNGHVLTKDGTNQLSLTQLGAISTSDSGGAIVVDQGVLSLETSFKLQNTNDYIIYNNPGGVAGNVLGGFFESTTGDITMPIIVNGAGVELGQEHNTSTSTISSASIALNNNVTFGLLNGATGGGLILSGNISDISSAFVNSLPASLSSLAIATGAGSITLNTGTLNFTGALGYSGTTTINQTGTSVAALTISGAHTSGETLSGAVLGTNGSLTIGDGTDATDLTMSNSSNNYTGTLTVDNGTAGAFKATGSFGATTLTQGALEAYNVTAGQGTLTLVSLTANGGDLEFNVGSGAHADLITITGSATLGSNAAISLNGVNGDTPTVGENVPILTSTSLSNSISATNGILATGNAGSETLYVYQGGTQPLSGALANDSNFQTNTNDLFLYVVGSAASLQWTGSTDGGGDGMTWDVTTNYNWWNTGTSAYGQFYQGDSVTFRDTYNNGTQNVSNYIVTLNTTVDPGSVTVNNSAGNYVISGTGSIGGSTSLLKEGADSLTLSTVNTYAGGTQVGNGKIILGVAGALPSGSAVTLGDGTADSGTLNLNGFNATVTSLVVAANSTGTETITDSSTSSALTFSGGTTADAFSGIITGTNLNLNVSTGSLVLSGNNNYGGGTTISTGATLSVSGSIGGAIADSGTFNVQNNESITNLTGTGATAISTGDTLTLNPTSTDTFAGAISTATGTTSGNLAINASAPGTGGLTLSGTNTYYGTTTINSGVVYVTNSNSLGSTTGGTVYVDSGATLDIGGGTSETIAFGAKQFDIAGTGAAGSLGVIQDNGGANGAVGTNVQESAFENVTLTGNATIGGTNEMWSTTPIGNDGSLYIGRSTSSSSNLTLQGYVLTKDGDDQFALIGGSSSGGSLDVTLNGGSIVVDYGVFSLQYQAVLNDTSGYVVYNNPGNTFGNVIGGFYRNNNEIVNPGVNPNSNIETPIIVNGGGVVLGESDPTYTSNIASNIMLNNNVTFTLLNGATSGGVILSGDIGNATSTIVNNLNASTAGESLTGAGVSIGTGAGSITLGATSGAQGTLGGTLTLSGTNTYSGATTIDNGTLNLGNNSAVQNSTVVDNVASSGLTFSSGIDSPTLGGLSGSGAISLQDAGSAAVTMSVGNNYASTTYSGVLSGSGALTKIGTGTLTLTGTNTYTGTTTISQGTLQIGNGGTTGSLGTSTSVLDNATLAFDFGGTGTSASTVTNVISGSGMVENIGTGTTSLTAANTYMGLTSISSGTLALGSAGTIADSAMINVQSSGTFNVSAVSGGFTLGGSASQTLTGAGNVTGNVAVSSSGTLSPGVASPTSLSALTFNGSVNLGSGSNFNVQVAPTTNVNDQLNAGTNAVMLGGTETISSTGTLTNGESFTVIQGKVYGNFSSAPTLPSLTGGLSWNTPLSINTSITGASSTYQTNYTYSVTNSTPSYISETGNQYTGLTTSENGGRNTTVTFLGGTVTTPTSLSVQFLTAPAGNTQLLSDVAAINGTNSDTYVLQMSYSVLPTNGALSPVLAAYNPSTTTADGQSLITNTFVSAVLLNTSGTPVEYDGAYAGQDVVGDYGINTSNDTVWAVLNYSDDDFVVLERADGDWLGAGSVNAADLDDVVRGLGGSTLDPNGNPVWSEYAFDGGTSVDAADLDDTVRGLGATEITGEVAVGGGGLVLSVPPEVPEPGSLALLVIGGISLLSRSKARLSRWRVK